MSNKLKFLEGVELSTGNFRDYAQLQLCKVAENLAECLDDCLRFSR